MNISILTVFEQLYEPFLKTSLVRRAIEKGHVSVDVDSFFSFVSPKERIDGPIFGHGAGMVIRPEVVERAVHAHEQKSGEAFKIFFSPQGKKLTQTHLKRLVKKIADKNHLMLLPARYEGMDARIEDEYADEIISIGDFVLMGGDLPAMVFLEGLLRLIPGVVGKHESVEHESFSGPFVDFPSFTQPVEWRGHVVPEVIRSGNHAIVDEWRRGKAVEKTVKSHFAWLQKQHLSATEKKEVLEVIPRHYVALMHTDVLVGPEKILGTTSVTTIDIHDIARSCKTYGVDSYFVVTPLKDQQKVVQRLLDFWFGDGSSYNKNRHDALSTVSLADSLAGVIHEIRAKEGMEPVVIATSARFVPEGQNITFSDQSIVWATGRPVLLLFGTGQGLAPDVLAQVDYILQPINGITQFNHLSVRSAAAIALDRWLGMHEAEINKKLAG